MTQIIAIWAAAFLIDIIVTLITAKVTKKPITYLDLLILFTIEGITAPFMVLIRLIALFIILFNKLNNSKIMSKTFYEFK